MVRQHADGQYTRWVCIASRKPEGEWLVSAVQVAADGKSKTKQSGRNQEL
jgi:hypothetical protein